MNTVAETPQPFPLSEGIGIFVGVVAWDVLSAGEVQLLKAALLAASGALAWYGLRCALKLIRRKRH